MSVTLTITGDDVGQVVDVLRLLGARVSEPAENHTETIPEPDQDHTEPEAEIGVPARELEVIRQPRLVAPEPVSDIGVPAREPEPEPVSEPVRRYTERRQQDAQASGDLELLATLTEVLRPAVDIAVQLGIKRTSCGGVARKLDRLADEGRCERGELPDGKRGYRRLGTAVAEPEPLEPPVDLPARAPYLHLGDLTGHALRVAWALHDHGPATRHELATRLALPEDDVRDTLRLLIRQGYVRRVDGNVVRYALTDDVAQGEGGAGRREGVGDE